MFDGAVYLDLLFSGHASSRIQVSLTHFAPGAKTLWHRHKRGQLLYITEGRGLVQSRGGDVVEVGAGDTIYTPPDEWHWHGASADRFMVHLAIWEGLDPDAGEPETEWEAKGDG
jgi:quercetin dioxygenase-like cupin family protein